jgi:hypothetical protein
MSCLVAEKKVNLQISYFLPQQQSQADPRVQADPPVQAPRLESRPITKPPLVQMNRLSGSGNPSFELPIYLWKCLSLV